VKNRWQTKVDALIRLAEDQRGKPEGDLAREKLLSILQKHPEAVTYKPILDLAWRDITTKDVVEMHRMGVSTDGSWTGRNLQEALFKMQQDYYRRMIAQAFGIPKDLLGHTDNSLPPKT
jgi:hypothetical protein